MPYFLAIPYCFIVGIVIFGFLETVFGPDRAFLTYVAYLSIVPTSLFYIVTAVDYTGRFAVAAATGMASITKTFQQSKSNKAQTQ